MAKTIYLLIAALLGFSTLILIIIKERTVDKQRELSLTAACYVMLFITSAFVLLGQAGIILLTAINEGI